MSRPNFHHALRGYGAATRPAPQLLPAALLALLVHGALLTLPLPRPSSLPATHDSALLLLPTAAPAGHTPRPHHSGHPHLPVQRQRPAAVPPAAAELPSALPAAPAPPPASAGSASVPDAAATATASLPGATHAAPSDAAADTHSSDPDYKAAYLHNPAPEYPEQALRLKLEGISVLRVEVGRNGLPLRIRLLASSGARVLDQAAEKAVWRYRFVPAHRGQQPVDAWVQVPVEWRLPDED